MEKYLDILKNDQNLSDTALVNNYYNVSGYELKTDGHRIHLIPKDVSTFNVVNASTGEILKGGLEIGIKSYVNTPLLEQIVFTDKLADIFYLAVKHLKAFALMRNRTHPILHMNITSSLVILTVDMRDALSNKLTYYAAHTGDSDAKPIVPYSLHINPVYLLAALELKQHSYTLSYSTDVQHIGIVNESGNKAIIMQMRDPK